MRNWLQRFDPPVLNYFCDRTIPRRPKLAKFFGLFGQCRNAGGKVVDWLEQLSDAQ
jgi:hypothetical protein